MTEPHLADDPRIVSILAGREWISPERIARATNDQQLIEAIERRLNGPARHIRIRPFSDQLREACESRLFVFFAGANVGVLLTLLSALVWSLA